MSGVFNSLKATIISRPLVAMMNLLYLIVISRILSPDEIGVQVITASIVMIVAELKSMGVGGYIIRKTTLSQRNTHTAFTVCTATSLFFAISLGLASSLLANFFDEPRLINSIIIISLSFLFIPYISINSAVLQRKFDFKKTSTIMLLETFSLVVSGIALAYSGFSYLSLPIAVLIGSFVSYLMHRTVFNTVDSYKFSNTDFYNVLRQGAMISYNSILRRLNESIPEIVIGKFSGTSNTALYSRGNGLTGFSTGLLLNLINPITVPYFSRERREGSGIELAFTQLNKLTHILLLPLIALVFVLSNQLISLFFGEQWIEAAWIAQYICVSFFFMNLYYNFNSLLIVAKKERHLALLQKISIFLRVSLCTIFAWINWELTPLAVVISSFLYFSLQTAYLHITFKGLLMKFHRGMLVNYATLLIILFISFLSSTLATNNNVTVLYQLMITLATTILAWVTSVTVLKHDIIAVLMKLRGTKYN